jgi:hypothetical protein
MPAQVEQLVVHWLEEPNPDSAQGPLSSYPETAWLPIVGPSCIVALRALARELSGAPGGFEISVSELAGRLGLGYQGGKRSPIRRCLVRLTQFGLVQWWPLPSNRALLGVPTELPAVPRRRVPTPKGRLEGKTQPAAGLQTQ